MLGAPTPLWRSFYPLGMKSGPVNAEIQHAPNNYRGRKGFPDVNKVQRVPRDQLKLSCPHCRFLWDHDTLTVWCPSETTHHMREHWMRVDWIRDRRHAYRYWYSMPGVYENPRTGERLGEEESSKRVSSERRSLGLTSPYMRLYGRERFFLSGKISKRSARGTPLKVQFPYPS